MQIVQSAIERSRERRRDLVRNEPGRSRARLSRGLQLVGGGALSIYGARLYGRGRNDLAALAVGLAGIGLVARSLLPLRLRGRLASGRSPRREHRAPVDASRALRAEASVTIARPAEDLYRFWRDFSNLRQILPHLEAVEVAQDGTSRWIAKGPAGTRWVWRAQIVTDEPNQRIAWRSLPDAEVPNAGTIRFRRAPADRGTEVTLEMVYEAPAGKLGNLFAKMAGQDPREQIADGLRRFQQIMEAGEIATTTGQPSGVA